MNKDIKDKWVAALRSGNYQQGQGSLRTENRYCCLGVLCEITGCRWRSEPDMFVALYKDSSTGSTYIPEQLREELGMSLVDEEKLATRNDTGATFSELADVIETYF